MKREWVKMEREGQRKGKGREKRKGKGREKGNYRRATRDSWRVWTMEIDGFRNHSQGNRKRLWLTFSDF
jgi:hypothetical protein